MPNKNMGKKKKNINNESFMVNVSSKVSMG